MHEFNRKAPMSQRLPFEIWQMVLEHVVDRNALVRRCKSLVRCSRFSEYCDLIDLARLYEVVNEVLPEYIISRY